MALLFMSSAHAVIVNTGECIAASTITKTCCDDPTAEACLDADSKVMNAKLKAAQESVGRRTSGLRDVAEENKSKADLMRTSAQLNLRSADHCEQLSKTCVAKCSSLPTSDAKFALGKCQGTVKIVDNLREQAARDEASAKRLTRGK